MLRNVISRLFVLALFCVPHAQIYALDNASPGKAANPAPHANTHIVETATPPGAAALAMDRQQTRAETTAEKMAETMPRHQISQCDESTGFVRLRGLPLCELDPHDLDEARHEPSAIKYRVLVEKGLDLHAGAFAENVADVLNASLGWRQAGLSFVRVRKKHDITVVLAQPRGVDRLCQPLRTAGQLSCAINGQVIVNVKRWLGGAQPWGNDVAGYRHYLINHEVGHLLGMSHALCPGEGQPAPIMLQQTLGLDACVANGTVTAVDLKMLKPYLPILQQRLVNADTDRLKRRPSLIVEKQPYRQGVRHRHAWVASQPPGYALAFKLTADD